MKPTKLAVIELQGDETVEHIQDLLEFGKVASRELTNFLEDLRRYGIEPCRSVPANELVKAIEANFQMHLKFIRR